MVSYMKTHRLWWILVLIGVFGSGGCKGWGDGRDHPIFDAAAKGDADQVRKYLDEDPTLLTEVYRQPPRGRIPFSTNTGKQLVHIAAEEGHVDVLKLLKERGADLNAKIQDSTSWQPIHYAAANNRVKAIAWLLDNDAAIDAKTRNPEMTSLHWAAKNRQLETVELLLARGAAVDAKTKGEYSSTPLLWFCETNAPHGQENDHLIAGKLLEKGANVNAHGGWSRFTPLHHACRKSPPNKALIEVLLAHKADVNAKSGAGMTPIELLQVGNKPVAEMLIAHGASREQWEQRKGDADRLPEPPEAPN
jgi:ankyrin repeat protein